MAFSIFSRALKSSHHLSSADDILSNFRFRICAYSHLVLLTLPLRRFLPILQDQ